MMNYTLMKLNPQLNDFQIYIQRQRRGIKTNVNRREEMAFEFLENNVLCSSYCISHENY